MRVTVHKNLSTGKWVLYGTKQTRNGERKDAAQRIGGDFDSITLDNCSFIISSEKSQQRIAKNMSDPSSRSGREVIAYAVGDLIVDDEGQPVEADPVVVTDAIHYNPSRSHHFTNEDGDIISHKTYQRAFFLNGADLDGNEAYGM